MIEKKLALYKTIHDSPEFFIDRMPQLFALDVFIAIIHKDEHDLL